MIQFNRSTAIDFLRALGFAGKDSAGLELRLIGNGAPESLWPGNSAAEWNRVESKHRQGFHIYFGVAHRTSQRGDKAHTSRAHALWVDLDAKDHAKDIKEGKRLCFQILEKRLPPELQPSILIDTGNGFHGYWLLQEPIEFGTDEERTIFESHLWGIAKHLEGDGQCCEVARVMRLPGSFNFKDKNNPKLCSIVNLDADRRFNLDDIAEYMPPVERGKPTELASEIPDVIEAGDL